MGMDPVTLGIAAGGAGQIFGAIGQNQSNARAVKAQNADRANLFSMGNSLMGQGANPYIDQINKFMKGLAPADVLTPQTVNPEKMDVRSLISNPTLNSGQDALMQLLRADPNRQLDAGAQDFLHGQVMNQGNPFDTSSMFSALGSVDNANIQRQVAQLRGGSSSLGQRFGTAMGTNEALLRQGALRDIGARNAGIQQSSYEAGMGRATGAAGMLDQNMLQLLAQKAGIGGQLFQGGLNLAGLNLQGATANQNATNQANQFNVQTGLTTAGMNAQAEQARNASMLQAIFGGSGMVQNDKDFMAKIFGALSGAPPTATMPQSALPGAIGDAGQSLMLLNLLKGLGKK